MAYIGREPQVGNFQVCDAISVVNGQAAYTMQVSSVNVSPETANHMLVSLNGVLQKPGSSFTVSGSTITFASNLVTGDVIDFIHILGSVLDLGVPSDSTVSLAKLTATGTKSSSTFLRGDNTFAAAGGTNASGFLVTKSSNQAISADTWTHITLDQEIFDTDSVFASSTFTVPSTGKYYIFAHARIDTINGRENIQLALYKGGSFYSGIFNSRDYANDSGHEMFSHFSGITSLTANDEIKLYARASSNAESVSGSSSGTPTGIESYTGMGAFKLIE